LFTGERSEPPERAEPARDGARTARAHLLDAARGVEVERDEDDDRSHRGEERQDDPPELPLAESELTSHGTAERCAVDDERGVGREAEEAYADDRGDDAQGDEGQKDERMSPGEEDADAEE